MKLEFREVYVKIFDDSYIRLRRCIKLRIKAIKLCEEKLETFSQSMKSAGKQSMNFDEVQKDDVVNIADQLEFTQDEKVEMKGEQLDYQIKAIQLNKIDEVSIEHSSDDSFSSSNNSDSISDASSNDSDL